MTSYEKGYLMVGGTLLPAFAAVATYGFISSNGISLRDIKVLTIFAIAAVVGGYVSSKMIQKI